MDKRLKAKILCHCYTSLRAWFKSFNELVSVPRDGIFFTSFIYIFIESHHTFLMGHIVARSKFILFVTLLPSWCTMTDGFACFFSTEAASLDKTKAVAVCMCKRNYSRCAIVLYNSFSPLPRGGRAFLFTCKNNFTLNDNSDSKLLPLLASILHFTAMNNGQKVLLAIIAQSFNNQLRHSWVLSLSRGEKFIEEENSINFIKFSPDVRRFFHYKKTDYLKWVRERESLKWGRALSTIMDIKYTLSHSSRLSSSIASTKNLPS